MGLFKKPPHMTFFHCYTSILVHFLEYETAVRSSNSSFGHSDPDSSSVDKLLLSNLYTVHSGFRVPSRHIGCGICTVHCLTYFLWFALKLATGVLVISYKYRVSFDKMMKL